MYTTNTGGIIANTSIQKQELMQIISNKTRQANGGKVAAYHPKFKDTVCNGREHCMTAGKTSYAAATAITAKGQKERRRG